MIPETENYERVLRMVLGYAEAHAYCGYNKFDALNSPLLKLLSSRSKWLRFAVTQAVMRSPWNLRPFLGVKKSVNPKGVALFASAYLNELRRTGSDTSLERARWCLERLEQTGVPTRHGLGWGYSFDWQSTLFFAPKYTPNAIVTVFCAEAFLKGFELVGDENYLHLARLAALFLRHDLPVLHESADELCIGYVPLPTSSIVLNINASAGGLLAKVAHHLSNDELMRDAERMIRFVVNRKTPYHGWYYTYPPGDSPIVHDNYHTGGILDALLEYERYSCDGSFGKDYQSGLEYYSRNLFLADGAPKFMNNAVYPLDIHGAAQGIITFSKASVLNSSHLDFADRIARWTLHNMFDERGHFFYYQKCRYYTKRFTLMRWCNAWMAKALSDLLSSHASGAVSAPRGTGTKDPDVSRQ